MNELNEYSFSIIIDKIFSRINLNSKKKKKLKIKNLKKFKKYILFNDDTHHHEDINLIFFNSLNFKRIEYIKFYSNKKNLKIISIETGKEINKNKILTVQKLKKKNLFKFTIKIKIPSIGFSIYKLQIKENKKESISNINLNIFESNFNLKIENENLNLYFTKDKKLLNFIKFKNLKKKLKFF